MGPSLVGGDLEDGCLLEAGRLETPDGEILATCIARPAGEPELAVLYLHGFASDQAGTKATFLRRHLTAAGCLVASFDARGCGASGGELGRSTLSRHLGDVELVAAELARRGWPRPVLFGSSFGGVTALGLAARRPDAWAGVVALAPALDFDAALLGRAGMSEERWRQEGVCRFEDDRGVVDLRWEIVEDFRRVRAQELARATRVPTLVFQGVLDDSVDWREVARFVAAAPGSDVELRLFADGEHRLETHLGRIGEGTVGFLRREGLLSAR